jgi:uncharacterized surface protein with fasciclin (FAS1) repeats
MPMPIDRIPRLVEGPAQVAGLNVEKGLAEAIARDVESPEALPLLAHTLWLLYRRGSDDKKLSFAEYQSLSDPERHLNPIQNSVRLVADQAIGGLKPSEEELAALRNAFVPHLVRVRLDDGKRVRQPARLSELPREALRSIRALVEARLLSTRAADESDAPAEDGDKAVVEVTHEALFKAWPTLDQWLTGEHAFLSDIERIKSAHEIWMQAPSDRKAEALLGGLLLSRAREWLENYPQRFGSRENEPFRQFIERSVIAESRQRIRISQTRGAAKALTKISYKVLKLKRTLHFLRVTFLIFSALAGSVLFVTMLIPDAIDAASFAGLGAFFGLGFYWFIWYLSRMKTLFQGAKSSDSFKTVVRAMEATGLDKVLGSTGPLTVFAPTDEAFAGLPAQTREKLFDPENKRALYEICAYHIVSGENNMDDLIKAVRRGGGLAKLRTLEGSDLTIEESRTGELSVTDSRAETGAVIISDIVHSNGIAHVVDTVFMPGFKI